MARTNQRLWLAWGACLIQLAGSITASPVQGNVVARRDVTETKTTTVTVAPTTVTVNPLDPTITREAGWTSTVAPPPFISTITSGCISYNYSFPPGSETTTTVVTRTVTEQSTVTVTDTDLPPQTHFYFHLPTVTVTTPTATYVSYHCTNTMVVQYADWEYLTWTWTHWQNVATTTGLCLTTSTRSTTLPGLDTLLPTPPVPPLEDWEYFSGEPGVTLVTKNTVAIATDTTVDAAPDQTTTVTICDDRNPRPTTTTTITVTRQQSTTTKTVTGGPGCAPTTTTRAPGARSGRRRRRGDGDDDDDDEYDVVEARDAGTPVEVRTVVYTTVTVITNSVYTLTGTAIVDINTQEFPVTRIAYATTTGTGVVTVTQTACN
ncbi:hypothetical protein MYCTH_100608 [Thermothelomyces thermophilus ATCC 42464]|uniref:Uncharacterized protein n=1 Tax=Thermothelomyces thermophilus (strain ATCC 42464 / BCRC 31852 / DSM 1799) TaxID=573729 RepID=G2Q9Q6_THET4|nr:uncharacterized protein MYCTH_100608 [Thermothelomyces thermophilus ATCC 42464]AEO56515.1 hypothetical protein MYCTH_100608 [Thermothelomyces thermophilus ATCC 42464]